ncbi:MAG: class I SAM-dependent RNA methyltransferase [Candidatus Omnitrophica bacterium]|nr:class I SAM-dependent RNA methyltransferase [Candidatus Omnitrophota bacterium]
MNKIALMVTSAFGLEAVVKRELQTLGFKDLIVLDGKIEFQATLEDIPMLNIWLRSADRVLLKLAEFKAEDFDQLFDQTKALPWDHWIPKDAKITVIGKSVKSTLKSLRANQSIVKKAIVEQLKRKYHTEWLPETGTEYTIQVSILKDVAELTLDTSGLGLHKRGYREDKGEVPLRENLAAALVLLSFWNKDKPLMDPMCGAGTILIEAAMIARNIAPGLKREFISEKWPLIDQAAWSNARLSARAAINPGGTLQISGYDISADRIKGCLRNAKNAGVETDIVFMQKDINDLRLPQTGGIMITNPPYGVKLSNIEEVRSIYRRMDQLFREGEGWSLYLLTADKKFPEYFKRMRPSRVRKLYNGTLQVNLYQYFDSAGKPILNANDRESNAD